MSYPSRIDWSTLEADYTRLGTISTVARLYGCSDANVWRMLKAKGIQTSHNKRGSRNPKWRGGRRVDTDGYVQVFMPDHPNRTVRNEVSEHRLVMEKIIGRLLFKTEVVHHKNGIKDDNRPENLELLQDGGCHIYTKHRRYRDSFGRLHPTKEALSIAEEKIKAMRANPSSGEAIVLSLWLSGKSRLDIAILLKKHPKTIHSCLSRLADRGFIPKQRFALKDVVKVDQDKMIELSRSDSGVVVNVA